MISTEAFSSSGQVGSNSVTVTVANGSAGPVKLTSPSNGNTVSGTVAIAATVTSAVTWINFYTDGGYLASSLPYSTNWDSTAEPNGSHTISAKAFNSSGAQIGSDSVMITVTN